MKSLWLLCLLLIGVAVQAQNPNLPANLGTIPGYTGNPIAYTIKNGLTDTTALVTAISKKDPNGALLEPAMQPLVTRAGRDIQLVWAANPRFPIDSYLEVLQNNATLYAGALKVNKNLSASLPSGTTVIQYVLGGNAGPPGSSSLSYPVANIGRSGYVITHNKANRFVRATFFREDTGQPDPLWTIRIRDANSDECLGPPGETFTGRITLEFMSQPQSN